MSELGKANYDGYRRSSGGKSLVSGQPIPEWDDMPADIREAWIAGATDVVTTALVTEGLQQLAEERNELRGQVDITRAAAANTIAGLRALLDESTRRHHATGMPGEQAAANAMRARAGLESL